MIDIHAHALEAFNRATHVPATPEFQIAPAEDLQAGDEQPVISIRFALVLAAFVAGIITHHIIWSAPL